MSPVDVMTSTSSRYYPELFHSEFRDSEAGKLDNIDIFRKVKFSTHRSLSSLTSQLSRKYLSEERKKQHNQMKLKEISKLEYDWNGNKAEPFSEDLINKANVIFHEMERQPKIFPTARHSIQFEYENEFEDYLEFEIFADVVEVYCEKNGEEYEYKIPLNTRKINKVVHDFYGTEN
jgi:hypothetical protein